MPPPNRPLTTRAYLSDAPAVTVVLVVVVLALVILPLVQLLGDGAGAQHGLEPLLEMAAVLLGLLVVSVSLHALEAHEQARANVLVVGVGVAAACNFLHGVLVHSGPVHMPVGSAYISLWLSSWARIAEVATLGLTATRLAAPGPPRVWLAVSGGVTLVVVGSAMGPLPGWFAQAAGGVLRQVLAAVLALALVVIAVVLYRRASRDADSQPRDRLFAWAAMAFVCGELTVGALGGHSPIGGPLAHGLRVMAYALLYQAVFDAGIRQPFARIQTAESRLRESESRLSLLGRNLPHSVLFQVVRELDGRVHFVHMGDAIERLNGVRVQEVLADPGVLYRQILEEDIGRLREAERHSFLSMTSLEAVFRLRRTDGQVRWMHLNSSPRRLDDGRVLWDGVQTDITAHHLAEEAARAKDALMANMLRLVPGGVARLDRDLRVLYVNEQQARWLYKTPQDLQGRLLQDVIPAEVFVRMQPHLDKAFAGETVVFENRIEGPDGMQYRHTTLAPEAVTEQGASAVVVFAYDLTALKRIEQELAHQKAHLARVVNAMPDMVFLKDAEGVYLSVNPVFERFSGRPERDVVGRNDYDLTNPAEAERFRKYDQRAMQAWQPLVYEETLTFAEDGYQGQFETIKTPIRDLHGRVTGVLGVCRDITDRKRAEQEIERLAFYDALTGLPNRRLLLDRLQRSIAACQRTRNLGALLFIDLDNFKDLNDTLGHDMGDQLLSQVAA
ncbi:PAS domain-containing protein, partial [Acidovorax sp. NB1]|uniref:PAS domain-containing protein n=1 Tax=Acidovorax sp. NB1 TaxID=1943571 RepID=UPI0010F94899